MQRNKECGVVTVFFLRNYDTTIQIKKRNNKNNNTTMNDKLIIAGRE